MNLILQLIVGGVIGWLASMVMKTNAQMGLIAKRHRGHHRCRHRRLDRHQAGDRRGVALSWLMAIVGASLLIAVLKLLGLFK